MKYKVTKTKGYQERSLYNMDCRDALSVLKNNSVDCFITSSTYFGLRGETDSAPVYVSRMTDIFKLATKKTKHNGTISNVVRFSRSDGWFDMRVFSMWDEIYRRSGLNMLNVILWCKTNPVPAGDLYNKPLDIPAYEMIFVGTKSDSAKEAKSRCGQRQYADTTKYRMRFGGGRGEGVTGLYGKGNATLNDSAMGFDYIMAPTAGSHRPVAKGGSFSIPLAKELIYRFSNPGDLVGDFFAGCCTTGKAAVVMGREFWGCDIDEQDLQKGCDWMNEDVQMGLL